jgi:beta-glucosidase
MSPYYAVSPFDGIQKKLTSDLSFTVGCHSHKELPLIGDLLQTASGKPGLTFNVYNDSPEVADRQAIDTIELTDTMMLMLDYTHPKLNPDMWYATVDGYLVIEEDGEFELGMCVYGTANLYVDGKLLIDNSTKQTQGTMFFGSGTVEETGTLTVTKGTKYHIRVEYAGAKSSKLTTPGIVTFGGGGLRIGGVMKIDAEKEIVHAAELAKEADQVIVCVGLNVCDLSRYAYNKPR